MSLTNISFSALVRHKTIRISNRTMSAHFKRAIINLFIFRCTSRLQSLLAPTADCGFLLLFCLFGMLAVWHDEEAVQRRSLCMYSFHLKVCSKDDKGEQLLCTQDEMH